MTFVFFLLRYCVDIVACIVDPAIFGDSNVLVVYDVLKLIKVLLGALKWIEAGLLLSPPQLSHFEIRFKRHHLV